MMHKNLLNIAINGNISVYKIIYGYQDMTAGATRNRIVYKSLYKSGKCGGRN